MRRKPFMTQSRILYIVWSFLLIGALYLFMRFAIISFSDDVGQASGGWKETILSKVYIRAMESGSSFMSYSTKEEELAFAFPINLVENNFVLDDFIVDMSQTTAKASENLPSNTQGQLSYSVPIQVMENEAIPSSKNNENNKKSSGYFGIYDMAKASLTRNYILSNGALLEGGVNLANNMVIDTSGSVYYDQLQIGILEGDIVEMETEEKSLTDLEAIEATANKRVPTFTMEQLKDANFLINTFYNVDGETSASESLFNADVLLGKDMTMKQQKDVPQILIYHTHSQEAFVDSREGAKEDTVVGMGEYLAKILEEKYGYQVIHDKSQYDIMNGKLDRNKAYNYARAGLEEILEENPTIEVVIDLHRDGVAKRSTVLKGEETAQIMLFNGLCRDQYGPLTRYDNPKLVDNLAFSLQLKLKSLEMYPTLLYKNYLHAYRYNQHLRRKSILMELGTYKNTVQSAKNALEPFADVLHAVLQGEEITEPDS